MECWKTQSVKDTTSNQAESSDPGSDPTSTQAGTQTESSDTKPNRGSSSPIAAYPFEVFPPPPQRQHTNPIVNLQPNFDNQDNRACPSKPRSGNVGKKSGKSHMGGRTSSSWGNVERMSASLPKTIIFDGKGSWVAFYQKFSLFADEACWNAMQFKNNLCLCLQGKASEVFAALTQRDPDLDFFELVGKLERRFGVRELPETSQIEFQYARQGPEEDVLEWADRVSHMATLAYAALPDDFVEQQCIMRFCQGCRDKESGQWALNMRPSTLEKAVHFVQWNKHTSRLVLGRGSVRQPVVRQSVVGDNWEDIQVGVRQVAPQREQHSTPVRSYQTSARQDYTQDSRRFSYSRQSPTSSSVQGKSQSSTLGRPLVSSLKSTSFPGRSSAKDERVEGIEQKVDNLEVRMSEMQSAISKLADAVTALSSVIAKNSSGSSPSPKTPRSPIKCFGCHQVGHYQRDCPQNSPRIVSFVECAPNVEGLEKEADL